MKVTFSKNSLNFLDKINSKDKEKIRKKIKKLVEQINDANIILYDELQIRRLKGDWKGCFRMRIGNIRVIFSVDRTEYEINIIEIDYRGNIYR